MLKNHSSPMSKFAWTDSNSKGLILKLHDLSGKDRCKCQRMICFTPKQFGIESNGFRNTVKKSFKGSEKAWISFLNPAKSTLKLLLAGMAEQKAKMLKLVKLLQIF